MSDNSSTASEIKGWRGGSVFMPLAGPPSRGESGPGKSVVECAIEATIGGKEWFRYL